MENQNKNSKPEEKTDNQPTPSGPKKHIFGKACLTCSVIVIVISVIGIIALIIIGKSYFSPSLFMNFGKYFGGPSQDLDDNIAQKLKNVGNSAISKNTEFVIMQADQYPHVGYFHVPGTTAFDMTKDVSDTIISKGSPTAKAGKDDPSWKTNWVLYQTSSLSSGTTEITFSLKNVKQGNEFEGTARFPDGKIRFMTGILLLDNGKNGASVNFPKINYSAEEQQQLNLAKQGMDQLRSMSGTTGFDDFTNSRLEATIRGETQMKPLRIILAEDAEEIDTPIEIEQGLPAQRNYDANDKDGDGLPDLVPLPN